MSTRPEALRLAEAIDPLTRYSLDNLTCSAAAAELRRLHEENQRLLAANKDCIDHFEQIKADYDSLKAQGQEPDHLRDATKMVDEPFGYFKAEPFGWTDCAETDEGAIALYERPAAQPAVCTWTQVDDMHTPDTWQADCGAVWTFTEGGPSDNDMQFCPKCGNHVEQKGGAA